MQFDVIFHFVPIVLYKVCVNVCSTAEIVRFRGSDALTYENIAGETTVHLI